MGDCDYTEQSTFVVKKNKYFVCGVCLCNYVVLFLLIIFLFSIAVFVSFVCF